MPLESVLRHVSTKFLHHRHAYVFLKHWLIFKYIFWLFSVKPHGRLLPTWPAACFTSDLHFVRGDAFFPHSDLAVHHQLTPNLWPCICLSMSPRRIIRSAHTEGNPAVDPWRSGPRYNGASAHCCLPVRKSSTTSHINPPPEAFHKSVRDTQPALTTTQVITIACLTPPWLDLKPALQFGAIIAPYWNIILPWHSGVASLSFRWPACRTPP